ncbi:hypothetical protein BKA67DRAFT_382808 [Truncatella angustata]|uniref:Uncharacterized protein n=1 Tax=Truncatella angustata TaxID=152316 RepID=A0A9P8UFW2_9PEZI|nr:uncharacterized protein BKA67DRAFT_382808 [Truncatella angustata]KAH6649167.1 hypothetical protein BKA67DRAFT_382808 [Truncatella angustata]
MEKEILQDLLKNQRDLFTDAARKKLNGNINPSYQAIFDGLSNSNTNGKSILAEFGTSKSLAVGDRPLGVLLWTPSSSTQSSVAPGSNILDKADPRTSSSGIFGTTTPKASSGTVFSTADPKTSGGSLLVEVNNSITSSGGLFSNTGSK